MVAQAPSRSPTPSLDASLATEQQPCRWEDCDAASYCTAGEVSPCEPVRCDLDKITLPNQGWQIVRLDLLPTSEGCDLNGWGKPENALGTAKETLGGTISVEFDKAIDSGVYAHVFVAGAVTGTMLGLSGSPDPQAVDAGCEPASLDASERCPLRIWKESYELDSVGPCEARATCSQAGEAVAGSIRFACGAAPQPVVIAPQITIPALGVTMEGTLPSADTPAGTMMVCGWMPLEAMLDVARNMPDDIAARFAGGRDGFLEFLELLLIPDIDGFGTGILDSISFAAEIELRQVDIKGWVHAP